MGSTHHWAPSQPSSKPGNRATLLLIVDALDECNDADDANAIIRCLEELAHIEYFGCRVLLTSRPEQPIKLGMNHSASSPREYLILHEIDRSIVDEDLKLYYRDQLSHLKAMASPEEDLISERTIGKLVQRSHGLFIHAATVCKFVRDGKMEAVERLNSLLKTQKADSAELELDKMYTIVMNYSFVSATDGLASNEVEKVRQAFQRTIGAIIVMFDTMSLEGLARLLGVTRERMTTTLGALQSVINVPERHSGPITFHPSFRDFLLNPNRCTNISYFIQVSDAHGHLGTRCLAHLMSELKRNILGISKPGARARDVSMERIDERIPIELKYSSRYWWNHLKSGDDHSREELLVLDFLEAKYLLWLECLAWLGKLGHAIEAMSNISDILVIDSNPNQEGKLSRSMPSIHRKSKRASRLHKFASDAFQFLLRNKLMIEEAPLQLYISALIFTPISSEVRERYRKEMPSWILNEPQTPDDRGKSPGGFSIAHSSAIHSVAISPDSSLVATACGDCMVHIWDVRSGMQKSTLEGNPDGVASVCFSPNGCLVAAFAQNIVFVWNIESTLGARSQPECQFRFKRQGSETASSQHPKCAISPCGNLVTLITS